MLLSDALGVTSAQLSSCGVHDSFLGIDSLLHVDPARLRSTRVPELKGAYKTFHDYFEKLLEMVAAAQPGDALERQSIRLLIAPEIKEAALGYARSSNSGRGVTRSIAERLYRTAKTIVEAGIKNPSIFELAILFEDDFGADLISDMTVFMLLPQLGDFNKTVAEKLGLPTRTLAVGDKIATCVYSQSRQKKILLIPRSLLSDLPLARDWSEIDSVSDYNRRLRKRINDAVKKIWGNRVQNPTKPQIKRVLLNDPELLRDLIAAYGKAKAEGYDFDKDRKGVAVWHQATRDLAKANPLALSKPVDADGVFVVVSQICDRFKHLVEQKGLSALVFDERGSPKPESASQLLYFGIADAYCVANNLDLSREPETGRGPADFKISKGHRERVIVELKLSSNSKAIDGLTAQLPTYRHAEEARHAVYVVLKVGHHERKLNLLREAHAARKAAGALVPRLVIIDALKRPSASKLRGSSEDFS